jgi:hypothetical protein
VEVIVVDQSTDDQTAMITRAMVGHIPGLAHHPMKASGVSRARNEGVRRTRGEIIVFLDDDCAVQADWLDQVVAAHARHPAAAIAFGDVIAAPHDWRTEYIPIIHHRREWVASGRWALLHWRGLGACMSVRRALFEELGGFDGDYGPGSGCFEMAEEAGTHGACYAEGPPCCVRQPSRCCTMASEATLMAPIGAMSGLLRGRGAADFKLVWSGEPIAIIVVIAHLWELVRDVKPLNLITRRGPSSLSRGPCCISRASVPISAVTCGRVHRHGQGVHQQSRHGSQPGGGRLVAVPATSVGGRER